MKTNNEKIEKFEEVQRRFNTMQKWCEEADLPIEVEFNQHIGLDGKYHILELKLSCQPKEDFMSSVWFTEIARNKGSFGHVSYRDNKIMARATWFEPVKDDE